MNPSSFLSTLKDAGVTLSLAPPNGVNLKPTALVTQRMIDLVKVYKSELLVALESSPTGFITGHHSQQAESSFNRRMALFFGRKDAKELAQRLQRRDRDKDDRRMCVECANFTANTSCRNHKVADVPSMVGSDFSVMLQRCRGFDQLQPQTVHVLLNDEPRLSVPD
jgi:hypothetical protein